MQSSSGEKKESFFEAEKIKVREFIHHYVSYGYIDGTTERSEKKFDPRHAGKDLVTPASIMVIPLLIFAAGATLKGILGQRYKTRSKPFGEILKLLEEAETILNSEDKSTEKMEKIIKQFDEQKKIILDSDTNCGSPNFGPHNQASPYQIKNELTQFLGNLSKKFITAMSACDTLHAAGDKSDISLKTWRRY